MKKSILKITKIIAVIAFVFTASSSFSQENVKQGKKSAKNETVKSSKKEVKTVCFKSNMTCNGCAGEVKHKVAYEKGVKNVETNLDDNTITVTYRADKNDKEALAKAIKKLGYEATETTVSEKKETK